MKHFFIPILALLILISAIAFIIFNYNSNINFSTPINRGVIDFQTNQPESKALIRYQPPELSKKQKYTIMLVGDSMTDYVGDNGDLLIRYLQEYYPNTNFNVLNYGFGSTNILSLDERLHSKTIYSGDTYPPILDQDFDIIIIESFGHNPLSNYDLNEGLSAQNQALSKAVATINAAHPNAVVVFLATVAPSEKMYAKGVAELSDDQRIAWVNERRAYIQNHIDYAQKHNIGLINVYERSLNNNGQVNLDLVSKIDYIHPSEQGVDLVSESIADFLYETKILPQ